jgi:hypothetical protein
LSWGGRFCCSKWCALYISASALGEALGDREAVAVGLERLIELALVLEHVADGISPEAARERRDAKKKKVGSTKVTPAMKQNKTKKPKKQKS